MAGNQTEADFVQRGAGRPQRKRMASRDKVIMELAAQFQDGHLECEDPWYSCPKSPEGCANDGQGDECNCGADYRAAKLKELLQLAWDAARAEAIEECAKAQCYYCRHSEVYDAAIFHHDEWRHYRKTDMRVDPCEAVAIRKTRRWHGGQSNNR